MNPAKSVQRSRVLERLTPLSAGCTALRGLAVRGAGFALALVLIAAAPGIRDAQAEISLTFGTYSADKPTAMVRQLRPSLDQIGSEMSAILGETVEIEMQIVRSYEAGVEQIIDGAVDFTRLGPASYVMAKSQNSGLGVLAMEKKRGAKRFNGVICVRSDSNIMEIGQLRGRSFAFGNERSTLGRYFAQLTLLRSGIRAGDLDRYEYLGRHDKVGRAVGSGLFDAGALEETTFQKLVDNGVPIRAIATFSNSTRPWVARAGLEPRVKKALSQALLLLADPEAIKALRFDGFLDGDDSDYEATREAIEQNPSFFARLQ